MTSKVNILVFGQLEEITGAANFNLDYVADTEILLEKLFTLYPLLKEKKFRIALNQKIISKISSLVDEDTIALLPPFSGG